MYRLALCCALLGAGLAHGQDRDRIKEVRKGDQIDRLARRLERDAKELREEVITHFRKTRYFKDLDRHAREIERLSVAVYKISDEKGRQRLVRELLAKIDDEVRDLDHDIRDLAREKGIDRKAYDHLRDELSDIARTLYRLRREI